MKKLLQHTALLLTALLPVACEVSIPFEQDGTPVDMNVNALFTPDTTVSVSVAKTLLPSISEYYSKEMISNACVELSVNGGQPQTLVYDDSTQTYTGDYRCRPNDNIRLNVTAEGLRPASCEITVPNQPKIEVLSFEKRYSPFVPPTGDLTDIGGSDTVIVCQLRITDPADRIDSYRLKVRNISNLLAEFNYFYATDIFTSSDMIFRDERLTVGTHYRPAYFSNVFDDQLFDGREHTFTVESRMRSGENPYMVIELQALSRDFFNYLKIMEVYDITDSDPFAEGFSIPSNVTGGTGIVGTLVPDRHIIPLR